MCSEDLECGICYEPYNAAQRCPRELRCGHSFCESCLVALCLDGSIACPLCRQITHVPVGVAMVRAVLRVDECVLERMMSAGVFLGDDNAADDDTDNSDEINEETPDASCLEETGESDSSSGSRAGRFRQSLKKMWRLILGIKPQGDRERDCVTDEEFRDFAIMSFYTF
ncbi:E3 ubiquitin-protein ligase-like [Gadus macrocephalus]|uniref:E3 ubiquitin-protein ligase-like n=1 Tax=Gadus macrocephalus TaxID=80720 RepID=UPI0028CBB553|nr:E3 ubiquitin-protein ligase-like [Gadus macrocephalus]